MTNEWWSDNDENITARPNFDDALLAADLANYFKVLS